MRLTPERIFKAGVLFGLLAREEQNWLKILGNTEFTKRVLEKEVYEKFSREHPRLAAEYSETVELMNRAIRKRKQSKSRRR